MKEKDNHQSALFFFFLSFLLLGDLGEIFFLKNLPIKLSLGVLLETR